ncbi:MAG TPA: hypothetical protein VIL74_04795 [Pyrinomonadaceae bacterium]|jgi:hypothetical protein
MEQLIYTLLLTCVFSFAAFAQNEICPKIAVIGGIVQAGASMSFTAQIAGNTEYPNLRYGWTISNGTILSGQGTASITLDTTGLNGDTNITAEVKIKDLPENCADTVSETGAAYRAGDIFPLIDEFGKLPRDEVRARVDAFFVALNNSAGWKGYIVIYGTNKEASAREKLIRNHIALLKYDANRITFVRKDTSPSEIQGIYTRLYSYPPGYEPATF